MFNNPSLSFLSMLAMTSFIGFGTSLFFLRTTLLKRILVSPVVGYSIISLTTAYLSYAGFGTNKMAFLLFIGLTLIAVSGLILRKKNITDEGELSLKFLIPVILFGLINAAIVLAPTLLNNAPYLFNDHATYISISEYLRNFGYSVPTNTDTFFWHNNTWQYQTMHLRMGAQFFVSFFAALLQTAHTIVIYPSILGVIAFMLVCSIGFLYLSFKQEKTNIVEITFVLFFYLIAINLNSHNLASGFLPQTAGTMLFITLTAAVYETLYCNKKHFVLISLLFAALVLTYHEITLFYGAGIFVLLCFEYFYKKNHKISHKVFLAHLLAIILSPIATKEFILGIYISSKTNGVGWDVPYSMIRYFQDVFGQDFSYLLPNSTERFIAIPGLYGSFIFIYLLLRKKFWDGTKEFSQFLLCIFTPFVLAIGIFAYLVSNPFTNQIGHTWNIFKLVSWSYWIIPVITGMVTFSYFRESLSKKIFILTICLLLLPSVAENVYANYLNYQYEIKLYTGINDNPLKDFKYLAENKNKYSPANIFDYQSHPDYAYLILTILQDNSSGDINIFGPQLTPSTDPNFFTYINYRREHANTKDQLKKLAGFFIYPKGTSSVYLFDGFSSREEYKDNHWAWLNAAKGTIKTLVPKNKKAQFTTAISSWSNNSGKVEIMLDEKIIFSSPVTTTPVEFTSPVMEEGNHIFSVNFEGELRPPDAKEGRTLGLMFKNTKITEIK